MTTPDFPLQHPPWGTSTPLTWVTDGDPEYRDLVRELRGFLDDVASARPEPAESAELATTLRAWRERLRASRISEDQQVFGRRPDLPSRGHTMLPDYVVHQVGDGTIRATVRFGRFYLGGGEAVHGGAIPLLFDELLGTLTNFGDQPSARTVNLDVNFRALTPLDTDLELNGRIERREGRKAYVSARLMFGDVLCADAQAIFVTLTPDQMRGRRAE